MTALPPPGPPRCEAPLTVAVFVAGVMALCLTGAFGVATGIDLPFKVAVWLYGAAGVLALALDVYRARS